MFERLYMTVCGYLRIRIPMPYVLWKAALSKWEAIIKAIEADEEWDRNGFPSAPVKGPCGFCEMFNFGLDTTDSCFKCPLYHVKICNRYKGEDMFSKFLAAINTNHRVYAEYYAEKIRDYIKVYPHHEERKEEVDVSV
jgi:hypothetical protein